ncbi:MAG: hypothetical protein GWN58_27855 [Anaerolineae bacterium]|nr:hypothetical protein [Anaerolineae bacterium]
MVRDQETNCQQTEQTFYTPTEEEFTVLRDAIIAKFSLNLGPRSTDKSWLAHYLWSNPELRRLQTGSCDWPRWFGPPKKPLERAIRYRTLQELYALPVWLVRADIEATKTWRFIWRESVTRKQSPQPELAIWYYQGRLVGEWIEAHEWTLPW